MGQEIRYYCDKCGKIIKNEDRREVKFLDIRKDLCVPCNTEYLRKLCEIKRWLENKE